VSFSVCLRFVLFSYKACKVLPQTEKGKTRGRQMETTTTAVAAALTTTYYY